MASVDTAASFARFIYPFRFRPATFEARARQVPSVIHAANEMQFRMWQPLAFQTAGALPHVASFLNAPVAYPHGSLSATALQWEVPRETTLPSLNALGAHALWTLHQPGSVVPFHLTGVRLSLFSIGIGFLTLSAAPSSTDLGDWLRFLHGFRFFEHRAGIDVRVKRKGAEGLLPDDFVPPFIARRASDEPKVMPRLVTALMSTGQLHEERDQWWHDIFVPGQLLPFVSLFVDGQTSDEDHKLLYRLRHFFGPEQGASLPPEEQALIGHHALIHYAERQWFVYSLEGGGFVACDAPVRFYREQLPGHLGGEYFLQFLLALHQRFILAALSEDVARRWPVFIRAGDLHQRRSAELAFTHLNAALLSFTARGYFIQVMQGEHHHRYYQKWQDTFQIERLYQEVKDEIQAMDGQLRVWRTEALEEQARHLGKRLSQLGLLLGGPGLALAYLGATGDATTTAAAVALLLGLAAGVITLFVVRILERHGA